MSLPFDGWSREIALCQPTLRSVKELIQSDTWIMEEKFDGDRVILVIDNGVVDAYGRRNKLVVPKPVKNLDWSDFSLVLDGEILADRYMVFDVLRVRDVACRTVALRNRKEVLRQLSPFLPEPVQVVPFAATERDKLALLRAAVEARKEGVVAKDYNSPYVSGRGLVWQKLKFYKTLDAVVLSIGEADGTHPEAARLGLYFPVFNQDLRELRDIGGVKIPMRYQLEANIQVGDVVEVRYLQITTDNKLFQPVYLRKRSNDKIAEECSSRQMLDHSTSLPYYMGGAIDDRGQDV